MCDKGLEQGSRTAMVMQTKPARVDRKLWHSNEVRSDWEPRMVKDEAMALG